MKRKRGRIIFLLFMLIAVAATTTFFVFVANQKNDNSAATTDTKYEYEALSNVDKNIRFELKSTKEIDTNMIDFTDQNGNPFPYVLAYRGKNIYSVNPPKNGYVPGNTYKLSLLDEDISFTDEKISSKREITFTVYREEVIDVKCKEEVITINNIDAVTPTKIGEETYIQADSFNDIQPKVGEIICVPTVSESGSVFQNAYKVVETDGENMLVTEPTAEELYENLDINTVLNTPFEQDLINQIDVAGIEQQILDNDVVKELRKLSDNTSKKNTEVKVNLKIQDGQLIVGVEVTFSDFFDGADLVLENEISLAVSCRINFSLLSGTFDAAMIFNVNNKFTMSIAVEAAYTKDGEGFGDLTEIEQGVRKRLFDLELKISKKKEEKEFKIPLVKDPLTIPISVVPLVAFEITPSIVFGIDLKAELGVTISTNYQLDCGVRRVDGLESYINHAFDFDASVTLSGTLEARFGLEIDASISLAVVFSIGAKFEGGVYLTLGGSAEIPSIKGLIVYLNGGQSNTDSLPIYGSFYLETGMYIDLSIYAKLKIALYEAELKKNLVGIKLPIFGIGHTEHITITPVTDSIVFDESGEATLPNVIVKATDLFSGQTSEIEIPSEELSKYFDIVINDSSFCSVDGNKLRCESNKEEFKGSICLKVKPESHFSDEVHKMISFGSYSVSSKRAAAHYEIPLTNNFGVVFFSKQPVKIDDIKLNYERIVDDTEYASIHPELSKEELVYTYDEKNNDYQIGRLVKVVPTIKPENASYKTLDYKVDKGEQYIVGGKDGIKLVEENGKTYAIFRVIEDSKAIGNVNGELDLSKEIKITATSNGYTNNYANWNISDSTKEGIYATAIPVVSYDFGPSIEGNSVKQFSVHPGEKIVMAIDNNSVSPRNATRGEKALESYELLSGNAKFENNVLSIDQNCEIGSQIVVQSSLSGVKRKYSFNVIKNDVDSVIITANKTTIKPYESVNISAQVTGINGISPTINEVAYVILNGDATLTEVNKNSVYVTANSTPNSKIRVIAVVDGKISNIIEIAVTKISVANVTLSGSSTNAGKGATVNFVSSVLPLNASYQTPVYSIISGFSYGNIDSNSGILTISNSCIGGEKIVVRSTVDGVNSNTIEVVVKNTPVSFIKFPANYEVATSKNVMLDAYVNYDATNKNISYEVIDGPATINGGELIINEDAMHNAIIHVKAISNDNENVYTMKKYCYYALENGLSINNQFVNVRLKTGSLVELHVTDSGNIVDNSLVEYEIQDEFNNQNVLFASINNGWLKINDRIDEKYSQLSFKVIAKYNGNEYEILIDVVIPPTSVSVVDVLGNSKSSLKPGESVKLSINYVKQANAPKYDDIELIINGKASAYIKSEILGYGLIENYIIAQIPSNSLTGDIASISVVYKYLGLELYTSEAYTIVTSTLTRTVEIENIVETMNINESIVLKAKGYPENTNYSPVYSFVDTKYNNYARLDKNTGVLTINNNKALVGLSLQLVAKVDGISSEIYTILITDVVSDIIIAPSKESENYRYIEKNDYYLLYPNGKLVVEANDDVTYKLDVIGNNYFQIDNNVITVKDNTINSGINATVVAYSENGFVSNTLKIYVPKVINDLNGWYSINDNIIGNYVLGCDIDLKGVEYKPIKVFDGILDGAGHIIKNYYTTHTNDDNCIALIEENHGLIINVDIRQFAVRLKTDSKPIYVAGIVAKNYGEIVRCRTISTEENMVYIMNTQAIIGGICAMNSGVIVSCDAQVYIESSGCGSGIAGENTKTGIVSDCANYDYIGLDEYDYEYAIVGIVGKNNGDVTNCVNRGRVFDENLWQYVVE